MIIILRCTAMALPQVVGSPAQETPLRLGREMGNGGMLNINNNTNTNNNTKHDNNMNNNHKTNNNNNK